MPELAMEIILARQFASCLTMPIFLVDPVGTLLYFNEPAETILGKRFEETGEMSAAEWSTMFMPLDETGAALPPEELPLMITLQEQRPAHRTFWISGLDTIQRCLDVTSFPIIGVGDRRLGAVAIFWEVGQQ